MAEDRGIEALAYAEVAGWFMGRADGAKLAALRDAYLKRCADPRQRPVAEAIVALTDREVRRRAGGGTDGAADE